MKFKDAIIQIIKEKGGSLTPQEIRDIIKNDYSEFYKTESHVKNVRSGHYKDEDHALLANIYIIVRNNKNFSCDTSMKPMKVMLLGTSSPAVNIKKKIEYIFDHYLVDKISYPFSGDNNLAKAFEEIGNLFSNTPSVLSREHLQVKVGYGKGNWASVPWV